MLSTRFAAVCAAALILCGCATPGMVRDSIQPLMGQPLDAAIAHFGYPASQMPIGDSTVYRWVSNQRIAVPTYSTATAYGNVGGTPFQATGTAMGMGSVDTACELDIAVQNGVMVNFNFGGQAAACQAFYIRQ